MVAVAEGRVANLANRNDITRERGERKTDGAVLRHGEGVGSGRRGRGQLVEHGLDLGIGGHEPHLSRAARTILE